MGNEPEQKKRKSPQDAKCSIPECGKSIKRGQGVCRACYDSLDNMLQRAASDVNGVNDVNVKLEAENARLVEKNAKLTTKKALRDNVLSPSFRFTVYQEVPKSPDSEWTPDPLGAAGILDGIRPAPKPRTVIEISDAGVVRCKMYMPEGERFADFVRAVGIVERRGEKPE